MEQGPATLSEAIALQPTWLRVWINILVVTHLASVVFFLRRIEGKWRIQIEAIAIFTSFFLGAALMEFLYQEYGYARILGLAHLIFWAPVFCWVLIRRTAISQGFLWSKYVIAYLVIAGASLIVDVIDVVRHVAGTA